MFYRFALLTCLFGCVALSASAQSAEAEKVKAAILASAAAFEGSDFETIAKGYAHDEEFVNIEGGRVEVGWQTFSEQHVKPGLKTLTNKTYKLSDVRVRVKGNVAWASFAYHFEGDLSGRRLITDGLGTKVLEKRKGQWLIVQSHTTTLPKKNP